MPAQENPDVVYIAFRRNPNQSEAGYKLVVGTGTGSTITESEATSITEAISEFRSLVNAIDRQETK